MMRLLLGRYRHRTPTGAFRQETILGRETTMKWFVLITARTINITNQQGEK